MYFIKHKLNFIFFCDGALKTINVNRTIYSTSKYVPFHFFFNLKLLHVLYFDLSPVFVKMTTHWYYFVKITINYRTLCIVMVNVKYCTVFGLTYC